MGCDGRVGLVGWGLLRTSWSMLVLKVESGVGPLLLLVGVYLWRGRRGCEGVVFGRS